MREGLIFQPQTEEPPLPPPDEVGFGSVEVLRLQPGDTLVYTHPNWLTAGQYAKVKDQLLQMIPEGVNLAILDDAAARFTIIRKEDEANGITDSGQTA